MNSLQIAETQFLSMNTSFIKLICFVMILLYKNQQLPNLFLQRFHDFVTFWTTGHTITAVLGCNNCDLVDTLTVTTWQTDSVLLYTKGHNELLNVFQAVRRTETETGTKLLTHFDIKNTTLIRVKWYSGCRMIYSFITIEKYRYRKKHSSPPPHKYEEKTFLDIFLNVEKP